MSYIQKHEVNTPEEHRCYMRKPRCEWVWTVSRWVELCRLREGLQAEWQMSHLASREVSLSELMCCDYSLSPAGSSLLHQSQRLDVQQRDSDRENSDKHTQVLMLAHTNLIKQDNSLCKHTHTLTQAYKLTAIHEICIVKVKGQKARQYSISIAFGTLAILASSFFLLFCIEAKWCLALSKSTSFLSRLAIRVCRGSQRVTSSSNTAVTIL